MIYSKAVTQQKSKFAELEFWEETFLLETGAFLQAAANLDAMKQIILAHKQGP